MFDAVDDKDLVSLITVGQSCRTIFSLVQKRRNTSLLRNQLQAIKYELMDGPADIDCGLAQATMQASHLCTRTKLTLVLVTQ